MRCHHFLRLCRRSYRSTGCGNLRLTSTCSLFALRASPHVPRSTTGSTSCSIHAKRIEQPWFCLSKNAAAVPAFRARPNAQAFASGVWHQVRVKYT